MALTNPTQVKTREYLLQKYKDYGLTNEDIGWDGTNVMVKGKTAFKPTSIQNGVSYTEASTADNAMGGILGIANNPQPWNGGSITNGFANSGSQFMGDPKTTSTPQEPTTPTTPTEPKNSGYKSPYADKINSVLDRILNIQQFNYNPESDPRFQALKQQYTKLGDEAYANQLGSTGGRINTALASTANQSKNAYNEKLMSMVPQMYANAYGEYQDGLNMDVKQLNELQTMDTTDYNRYMDVDKTKYDRGRQEVDDYLKSIWGMGDQMDYMAEANKFRNDNDPSNDWKISEILKARQNKIDTKDAKDFEKKKYSDTLKQKLTENSMEQSRIGISGGNLGLERERFNYAKDKDKATQVNDDKVASAYYDYVQSGLNFNEWLKKDNNGEYLTSTQLKELQERAYKKDSSAGDDLLDKLLNP